MKVVLDACVLFPTLTRGLLLDAAAAGVFTPLWSDRITSEWTHAARKHTDSALVGVEAALLADQWPDAVVAIPEDAEEGLSLPDVDDRHVLAAAIAGQAQAIVTFNMRDFPGRTLAQYDVQPWHPDVFLLTALAEAEAAMLGAVQARLTAIEVDPTAPRGPLKRARLPRFAKAVAALV